MMFWYDPAMKKKAIGRPPVSPKDKRSVQLPIRLTAGEMAELKALANQDDVTLSTWVRDRLLKAGEE
jgi:hypothetical protein